MIKYKKQIIISAIALLVIAVIIAVIISANQGHRVISVEEKSGDVMITRGGKDINATDGMNLVSEDYVALDKDSAEYIKLLVDDDKHISAFEGAEFEIVSAGNPRSGRIDINQKSGKIICAIDNKLNKNSSFEVHTPNTSLSVRGTIFESKYDIKSNITDINVDEGIVHVKSGDEERDVNAGESVSVIGNTIYDNNYVMINMLYRFYNVDCSDHIMISHCEGEIPVNTIHFFGDFYQINKSFTDYKIIENDDNLHKIYERLSEYKTDIKNTSYDYLLNKFDEYTEKYINDEPVDHEYIDFYIDSLHFNDANNNEVVIPVCKTIISAAYASSNIAPVDISKDAVKINPDGSYWYIEGIKVAFMISPEYYDLLCETLQIEEYM